MRAALLTATALGCVVLAACGDETGTDAGGAAPITQRAIAAVALEHLPDDTTSRRATFTDEEDPSGALGADLRYGGDGESDGSLLRVFIAPEGDFSCGADEYLDGCEKREVDAGTLFLAWTEEEPEEDPGFVHVVLAKDDGESVVVGWSGDTIVGDPRQQDLAIPIGDMEAVAQDPRLSLTTSRDVLELGEELDGWEGGEPDPTAHDRVPSTDRSLLNAYLSFHGGYSAYSGFGSSPLKAEWGAGAVGGRMEYETYDADSSSITIDVLAAPDGPEWLRTDDPCTAYAGECSAEGKGRYLAWTPGPDGEVWHLSLRERDVVGVRYAFDVPARQRQVDIATEWSMLNMEFVLQDIIGIETDKEMLDWDTGL